jgi:hypothetical protein
MTDIGYVEPTIKVGVTKGYAFLLVNLIYQAWLERSLILELVCLILHFFM